MTDWEFGPHAALAKIAARPSTNVLSEDATGCCTALKKALAKAPDLPAWTCPKCGMDWKPREVDGMRLWEAHPVFMVWR